jgi:hypothetical protein
MIRFSNNIEINSNLNNLRSKQPSIFQAILERNSFQLLNRGSIYVDDLLVIVMDPRKSVIQGDQLLQKLKVIQKFNEI